VAGSENLGIYTIVRNRMRDVAACEKSPESPIGNVTVSVMFPSVAHVRSDMDENSNLWIAFSPSPASPALSVSRAGDRANATTTTFIALPFCPIPNKNF